MTVIVFFPTVAAQNGNAPACAVTANRHREEAEMFGVSKRDFSPELAAALSRVEEARSQIPSLRRSLVKATDEANKPAPARSVLEGLLSLESRLSPLEIAAGLESEPDDRRPLHEVLGTHVDHLIVDLKVAAQWWGKAETGLATGLLEVAHLTEAADALSRALKHALYFSFLADAQHGRVGQGVKVDDYCQDWDLTSDQIDEIWLWVNHDGLRFDGVTLDLAIDAEHRIVYRKARGLTRLTTGLAPLGGAAVAMGLVAGFFAILRQADMTSWPDKWVWKMLVLLICVVIGAVLHLGSKALDISYDRSIRVYDAGGIWDWLSLRWLGVLQMYIPITFVLASLWGAGSAPNSFQDLGTAILAGYSADSLFRKSVEHVRELSEKSAKPAEKTTTTAGMGAQLPATGA